MSDRSDIQTSFQFIDADEGRLPKSERNDAVTRRRAGARRAAVPATFYSSKRIDSLGQTKIKLGQAAFAVR